MKMLQTEDTGDMKNNAVKGFLGSNLFSDRLSHENRHL